MCIRPLAGCRLFLQDAIKAEADYRIRPLAGCKLFPLEVIQTGLKDGVFVPLRGVDCFLTVLRSRGDSLVFVPLRGVDCFHTLRPAVHRLSVFVPLRGVDCFGMPEAEFIRLAYSSPCGV